MTGLGVVLRFLRTLGVFAVLGPLVGTFCVISVMMLIGVFTGAFTGSEVSLAGFAFVAFVGLIFGYGLGFVPAAATGAICHLFARRIGSDLPWVAACGATGIAVTYSLGQMLNTEMWAPLGGLSAAVCAWVMRRWRWT